MSVLGNVFGSPNPTVTTAVISGAAGDVLTLTFSKAVTGVEAADYELSGVSVLSDAEGSGTTWAFTITPGVDRSLVKTLSYTGAATVDEDDNSLATFSGMAVTNSSTYEDTTAPDAPVLTAVAGNGIAHLTWTAVDP